MGLHRPYGSDLFIYRLSIRAEEPPLADDILNILRSIQLTGSSYFLASSLERIRS